MLPPSFCFWQLRLKFKIYATLFAAHMCYNMLNQTHLQNGGFIMDGKIAVLVLLAAGAVVIGVSLLSQTPMPI